MSRWEAVIGLEVHVQLATKSKIFSAAPVTGAEEPNTDVDAVTLGMPGVLPVINRHAVELALRVGLALGCDIAERSRFARKHYFYPDLPKGYQISQYDEPLMSGGGVWATLDDGESSRECFFPLTRIHMEEDAGKTIHSTSAARSYVDFNRAGVPLIEIVSEPCMHSAAEAVAYLKALHQVVVAVGSSAGNLERGNFRCDANVSVRRRGDAALGTRTEIKNVNSFRFVGRAIAYEIRRQVNVIEGGGQVIQETRTWDESAGKTRSMRSKEEAHDYRYFSDPDLMIIEVPRQWADRVFQELPELPRAKRIRFEADYELSRYDADVLTQSVYRADFFEQVAREVGQPKLVANWITGELLGALNRDDLELEQSPIEPDSLAELLKLLCSGTLSGKMAKQCFAAMYHEGQSPAEWVAAHGGQVTDEAAIAEEVRRVIASHPEQADAFRGGKTKLLGFFVGQVMKATRGKANPQVVNALVKRLLSDEETKQ